MRVILDTNVFVSGVFFGGPPGRILEAWRDARVRPVLSAQIFEEYRRVGELLSSRYSGVTLEPLLALLAVHAEFVEAPALAEPIASDPDDDKFLACAVAAGERDRLRRQRLARAFWVARRQGSTAAAIRRRVPTGATGRRVGR